MKEQAWAEADDGQKHRADHEDENGPLESLKAAIMIVTGYHRSPVSISGGEQVGGVVSLLSFFFMFTSIVLMNNCCKKQSMEGLGTSCSQSSQRRP